MGQQMTPDTAKIKCKNFLATLLRLASDQPEGVAKNVRALIQVRTASMYDVVWLLEDHILYIPLTDYFFLCGAFDITRIFFFLNFGRPSSITLKGRGVTETFF